MDNFNQYITSAEQAMRDAGQYNTETLGLLSGFKRVPTDTTATNMFELAKTFYQNDLNQRNYDAYLNQIDPKNQLQRLISAGINPSYAYNQVTGGNASSPMDSVAPSLQGGEHREYMDKVSNVMNVISTISDMFNKIGGTVNSISSATGNFMELPQIAEQSYLAQMRKDFIDMDLPFVDDITKFTGPGVPIYLGERDGVKYGLNPRSAVLFPELVQMWRSAPKSVQQEISNGMLKEYLGFRNQSADYGAQLRKKQLKVSKLVDDLVNGVSSGNMSFEQLLQTTLSLILIQSLRIY